MALPEELFDPQAFARALPKRGPLLGIDPGTKTIGLAISDGRWSVASPLTTIRRTKLAVDLQTIAETARREAVTGLVIGMPLNMDGSAGPRAQSVRAFRRSLNTVIDLPTLFWDERLSSEAAEANLQAAGVGARKRAATIDAAAAAHILSEAMRHLSQITIQ